jgi:hypothetical protein
MSYMDFSSWPREQEQHFVVYEQHSQESSKKALMAGVVAAIAAFVVMLGIYAGVSPDKRDVAKDMNMSNLTSTPQKAAPAAPAPTPAAAPAATPAPAAAATPAPAAPAAPAAGSGK